ncbi:hypothetical protein XENTR_v10005544 [Xenopus tropicalis]|uniref:Ladinin-1 n=1 Tax=Xenopus tropicalis TaxID=8364 RepID=Q0IHL8_XENTR|nr:ladinin-1 [Xenopus tropicalis]AAI23093.1 ladinin 1 [Xenopus tropicalis]KAE8623224.1 hypothetical protein XENTR_v10005544 [Xenopus tropicalis]|eukprot:NP_001072638.1 ladinin-1 [Xenopus tropicalis]
MSLSKGNWSALSRLTKQWSVDDEEEQIRERRRRNRICSNPGEKAIELLSEDGESDKSLPSSMSAHSSKETGQKEQTEKHQKIETGSEIQELRKPSENQELRSEEKEKSKCHKAQNSQNSRSEIEVNNRNMQKHFQKHELQREQSLESKKQTKEINKSTVGNNSGESNSQEEFQGLKNQVKESLVSDNQKEVSQGPKQQNKGIVDFQKSNHKINGNQEPEDEKLQRADKKKEKDTDKLVGQDIPGTLPSSLSISAVHRDVATDIYPSSDSLPLNDHGTSSSTKTTETYRSQVYVSTVKISKKHSTSDIDDRDHSETALPVQNKTEVDAPSFINTIKRTEMHIPSLSSRSNSNKEGDLPLSPPHSSQIRQFSPRTSSFRALSQTEDKDDGAFSRNSNLRFSLRSRNIEDRMEKYASAVQRSGSVRISKPQSRCVIGASDGIASKRSIFEKDDNPTNKASSITKKQDFTLPVAVTSRINQWASKTQEDSTSAARPKEISTGHVSNKKKLWQQKSQSSSDTKL